MWPFTRFRQRKPPTIEVPRSEEVLHLQAELADARVSHEETVKTVRRSLRDHRHLLDDALLAFEGSRHVGK